jgi:rsbT co-antagonist protein RsbR
MDEEPFDLTTIRAAMNLEREQIDQRKAWLGLDDSEAALIRQIHELVGPDLDTIIDDLARDLVVEGNGHAPLQHRARQLLRDYFGALTNPDGFGDPFVEQRLAMVDALQEHVSPDVSWYLAAYFFYLQEVAKRLREAPGGAGDMQQLGRALAKVIFLDLGLAIDAHVFEHNRTIRAQQRQIEQLSTPVLQLREGLLIMPVVGILDARRAQQLTEQLLEAIRARRGKVVVLDITGVAVVDSRVANHLIQTVDAARLMGATAIVTGVSPEVAQTLVGLGIDLGNVTTVGDLQGGVDEADRLLGLRVASEHEPPAGSP